jgi:cytochrome c-type biogenesis protein CcsB
MTMGNLLSTKFLYLTFSCYCVALLFYLVLLGAGKKVFLRIAMSFMTTGILFHTIGILFRTREFGHFPATSMFEYLLIAAWFTALGYFIVSKFIKNPFISAGCVSAIIMLMLIVSVLPKEGSTALMPALRSYWLYIHVTAAAASEGLFAIGFISSVLFVIKSVLPPSVGLQLKIPDQGLLEILTYRSIAIGYLLFTLGALFAGAIWAHRAWGSFWSWDPKETCSLVVWIIYSAYLHIRLSGRPYALVPHILSIAGFIAALLTFFSSLVMGGMHSYG